MPVNVIGLLNIAIGEEEYVINDYLRLVSREYFEKEKISMPPDIRFYKTFIVSKSDFGENFTASNIPNHMKDGVPTYFLWAMKLYITRFNIVNSEWFAGETYETLKEIMAKTDYSVSVTAGAADDDWVRNFKIDEIVHELDQAILGEITELYKRIVDIYKNQDKSPEDTNLHWLYSFTKFQECCSHPYTRHSVTYITSAMEFLLVNSSNESDFRAAYYAALIYADEFEDRLTCFNFLKWAFSVREKLARGSVLDLKPFVDKSQIPENIHKLKEILAVVLLKTLGLTNRELQDQINGMIFHCPRFIQKKEVQA